MLQVKALPVATTKSEPSQKQTGTSSKIPYNTPLVLGILGIVCLLLSLFLWWFGSRYGWFHMGFVASRGLGCALLMSAIAFAVRACAKSPLTEDTTVRRTFFVIGVTLIFPAFLLMFYLYDWAPQPRHVSFKRTYYTYGSERKWLPQDSTPIAPSEHDILWMTDVYIDQMYPMQLFFYFRTLEKPTFSYNFQDNYGAVKDTHRIWITVNIILFILAITSIVASFFMPKQVVVVTGWSGSEWQ